MFKAVEWGEFMRGSIANCETQAEKTVLCRGHRDNDSYWKSVGQRMEKCRR